MKSIKQRFVNKLRNFLRTELSTQVVKDVDIIKNNMNTLTDNMDTIKNNMNTLADSMGIIKNNINTLHQNFDELKLLSPIPHDMLGRDAIIKLLCEYRFDTVLDLGAGKGEASSVFLQNKKQVTAISAYSEEDFPVELKGKVQFINCDFMDYEFNKKFDCIWVSHVLEHQRNVGIFLDKMYRILNDGGIAAITVPPSELLAGGGHINSFSESHLIYQCLMSNFDLTDVRILKYGYNLSIIVRKKIWNNEINDMRSHNYAELIVNYYDRLPKYIINEIEKHIEFTWNGSWGDERIPNNIKFKW